MRWLWRRRGRRRRGDELVQRDAVHWDASWGDTFLPEPTLPPTDGAPPEQLTPVAESTVRLGFSDGTHCELPSDTEHFDNLVALAARLTRAETRQRGLRRRS